MDDLIDAAAVSLNAHPLKTKQREAVEAFMKGNDVFVALPTGYGKSAIFGILPAAYDILRGHTESKSIAIVFRGWTFSETAAALIESSIAMYAEHFTLTSLSVTNLATIWWPISSWLSAGTVSASLAS